MENGGAESKVLRERGRHGIFDYCSVCPDAREALEKCQPPLRFDLLDAHLTPGRTPPAKRYTTADLSRLQDLLDPNPPPKRTLPQKPNPTQKPKPRSLDRTKSPPKRSTEIYPRPVTPAPTASAGSRRFRPVSDRSDQSGSSSGVNLGSPVGSLGPPSARQVSEKLKQHVSLQEEIEMRPTTPEVPAFLRRFAQENRAMREGSHMLGMSPFTQQSSLKKSVSHSVPRSIDNQPDTQPSASSLPVQIEESNSEYDSECGPKSSGSSKRGKQPPPPPPPLPRSLSGRKSQEAGRKLESAKHSNGAQLDERKGNGRADRFSITQEVLCEGVTRLKRTESAPSECEATPEASSSDQTTLYDTRDSCISSARCGQYDHSRLDFHASLCREIQKGVKLRKTDSSSVHGSGSSRRDGNDSNRGGGLSDVLKRRMRSIRKSMKPDKSGSSSGGPSDWDE